MAHAERNTPKTGFLCCGLGEQASEISEMFGNTQRKFVASSQATFQAISNGRPGQEQMQDWSNPFDYMRQERHSHEEVPRFAKPPEDDRSVATHSPRRSADIRDRGENRSRGENRDNASLGDSIPYNQNARVARVRDQRAANKVNYTNNRALELQEHVIMNTEISQSTSYDSRKTMSTKGATSRQLENKKLIDKHLMINRQLSERAFARREAAYKSKAIRQQALLVKNTESTRARKQVTPDDVRDPETVAGMKCQVEIELEEAAKKQAVAMLNDEQYRFNHKAGIAAFSAREIAFNHRKTTTTLGPMV